MHVIRKKNINLVVYIVRLINLEFSKIVNKIILISKVGERILGLEIEIKKGETLLKKKKNLFSTINISVKLFIPQIK